jgi:hypothetical protein
MHAYCDTHPEEAPGKDCPFCEDRTAYRSWERKLGVAPDAMRPAVPGKAVPVHEVAWSGEIDEHEREPG